MPTSRPRPRPRWRGRGADSLSLSSSVAPPASSTTPLEQEPRPSTPPWVRTKPGHLSAGRASTSIPRALRQARSSDGHRHRDVPPTVTLSCTLHVCVGGLRQDAHAVLFFICGYHTASSPRAEWTLLRAAALTTRWELRGSIEDGKRAHVRRPGLRDAAAAEVVLSTAVTKASQKGSATASSASASVLKWRARRYRPTSLRNARCFSAFGKARCEVVYRATNTGDKRSAIELPPVAPSKDTNSGAPIRL